MIEKQFLGFVNCDYKFLLVGSGTFSVDGAVVLKARACWSLQFHSNLQDTATAVVDAATGGLQDRWSSCSATREPESV